MDDRIGLNSGESRELKLGTTFSSHHNAFHTLKYDFKPASVDLNKEATVEVGTNNQVQVTVPHLDGSGVPKTVFKGNQKKYAKECVLVIDKTTGEITLEKLTNNISVKKTRTETVNKANGQLGSSSTSGVAAAAAAAASMKLPENSTKRTMSKTKVSTGVRKTNNAITGYMPKHSPNSISDYPHHKSPQSAPAWNANNGQSTLPSIPIIDDDVTPIGQPQVHHQNHHHMHHQPPPPQQQQQQQSHHPPPAPSSQMSLGGSGGGAVGGAGTELELMSSSDSSSESSYSSDSDSSQHSAPAAPRNSNTNSGGMSVKPPAANLLKEDLQLSDSNSDSD